MLTPSPSLQAALFRTSVGGNFHEPAAPLLHSVDADCSSPRRSAKTEREATSHVPMVWCSAHRHTGCVHCRNTTRAKDGMVHREMHREHKIVQVVATFCSLFQWLLRGFVLQRLSFAMDIWFLNPPYLWVAPLRFFLRSAMAPGSLCHPISSILQSPPLCDTTVRPPTLPLSRCPSTTHSLFSSTDTV